MGNSIFPHIIVAYCCRLVNMKILIMKNQRWERTRLQVCQQNFTRVTILHVVIIYVEVYDQRNLYTTYPEFKDRLPPSNPPPIEM